jgi:prepilin-type N-terminal cleavage/methylation domain-containing protein
MKKEFRISDFGFRIDRNGGSPLHSALRTPHSAFRNRNGFTLIEVMVVMTLLSLIVLVLMAVFNSTQAAFRAGVTQAGVLESGRATMDLMASDLRQMSPSLDSSNMLNGVPSCAVNFGAIVQAGYVPLVQPLVASGPAQSRTNVQESIFILSRQNQTWTGVGYVVVASSPQGDLDSLYRWTATTNTQSAGGPWGLFTNFIYQANNPQANGWSQVMNGVVSLTVRAYDINGGLMASNIVFSGGQATANRNVYYPPSTLGQTGFYMFSNTLPASVEIELGALEDRILQRAGSLPNNLPAPPPNDRQTMYLQGQAGAVHIFRQRVSIPNVDPSAYQ